MLTHTHAAVRNRVAAPASSYLQILLCVYAPKHKHTHTAANTHSRP